MSGMKFQAVNKEFWIPKDDMLVIDHYSRTLTIVDRMKLMQVDLLELQKELENQRLWHNEALQRALKQKLVETSFGEKIAKDVFIEDCLGYVSYSAFKRRLQRHHLQLDEVKKIVQALSNDGVCRIDDGGYTFFSEIFDEELQSILRKAAN